MQVECVVDSRSQLGEGAVWDARENCLWWVDIDGHLLHRFDPETGKDTEWDLGEQPGCLAVRESGGLVIARRSGFWFFDPKTGAWEAISDPEADMPDNRFNDGTIDRQGRFWAGTMFTGKPPQTAGTFYRLDADKSVTRGMDGFYTTNGSAFSPDGRTMYASDSNKDVRTIWAWDYDTETGTPSNQRVFFDTREVDGRPDGGTVDADGCYWMAGIDGWQIVRITPAGKVDRIVELPIERPTKPTFGGAGLDTLFVTSLSLGLDPNRPQPQAGSLFAITGLGTSGLEDARFQG